MLRNYSFLLLILGYLSSCNYTQENHKKTNTFSSNGVKQDKKSKQLKPKNSSCFCDKDTLMNTATISCDTTQLSNKTIIYWQFNCDKIWLTLENEKKEKFIIDDNPVELYGYTYRLGYHLTKEFQTGVLFRSGCPANGNCIYTLIDKYNGKILDEFHQLICIEGYPDGQYPFDFVVYFSGNKDHIIIEYIESKKRLRIPFLDKLTSVFPEQQFKEMLLDGKILTLKYNTDKNVVETFKINLADKKYLF